MTVLAPTTWTTGSTEVFKTGTWRAALPRHVTLPSPCHQACPVSGEIADWIGHARAGDWHAAWRVLVRHNPFPAVIGRICHHPCETACNRAGLDGAVSIRQLERHAGDLAIAERWAFEPPAEELPGHVAVLGAGPAGLSAAYQLRRRGWRVTVYEASAESGGLMRHGIPPYRLERAVLDAEIGRIAELGVTIRCGQRIGDEAAFERLRATHDAVFVATGAARVRRLRQLDAAGPAVLDGSAWLAACNAGAPPRLGPRVVVIGGGSAAFDAARSARRLGHAVTLLALESLAQLPAQREEVDEALDEGVEIVAGAMLERLEATPEGQRLHCRRVHFTPGAERGAFDVTPIDDGDFTLHADALITSIGQDPDLSPFGAALPRRGALLATDAQTLAAGAARVWAGGDVASQDRFVSAAIGMGQAAAQAMHAALRGEALPAAASAAAVPLASIATWYHEPAPRATSALRPVDARLHDGGLVQLPLAAAQALAEARRCFSCGSCVACDNCITVCPDMAVQRGPWGSGYTVLDDYCKGCGLCVRECPTGSMTMIQERK